MAYRPPGSERDPTILLGEPKRDNDYEERPDGSKYAYEHVTLHRFTKFAMNTLFANMGKLVRIIVREELDARGLPRLDATASDSKGDDNGKT